MFRIWAGKCIPEKVKSTTVSRLYQPHWQLEESFRRPLPATWRPKSYQIYFYGISLQPKEAGVLSFTYPNIIARDNNFPLEDLAKAMTDQNTSLEVVKSISAVAEGWWRDAFIEVEGARGRQFSRESRFAVKTLMFLDNLSIMEGHYMILVKINVHVVITSYHSEAGADWESAPGQRGNVPQGMGARGKKKPLNIIIPESIIKYLIIS